MYNSKYFGELSHCNFSDLQGGKRLNALFGINFSPCCEGFLKNQQFFVQGELPILQSLDGPQLQTSWTIRVAWQRTF